MNKMGKTMVPTICLVAATLFVVAVAGPLDRAGSCARQCTENSKFRYENGKHYAYEYEMETVSTLEGATKDASRLHMRCMVELHVISPCEMVMRLSGVTLEQSGPQESRGRNTADEDGSFRTALESYPLRFAFQNGRVENICPKDEETLEALNIKRAILSAFQTTTGNLEDSEKVIETDVSGTCTTIYEAMKRGSRTQSIRKSKDLASCTGQDQSDIAPITSKSQPLLKGTQSCVQTYKHNRLDNVQCTENHMLRPFSRQQKNGAVTKITLSLTYKNEGRSGFSGNEYFSKRHELNFDRSEIDQDQRSENVRMAEEALTNLCQGSITDIRPAVPRLFTTFVHKIQPLSHSDLVNMRRQLERFCQGNDRASKIFVDAVAMCGSAGAAQMVSDMVKNGDLSDADLNMYLSSLVFVKNPNREMLAAVFPLLDRREAFLGVSSLVHTYCTKHSECQKEREIQMIVRKISGALGNDCTNENKANMLMVLKALGNMGANTQLESILRKCMENAVVGDEVRVATLQAYRRANCEDTPLTTMMDLFRNPIEKVEVRIAAFVGIMKCPNMEVISAVKDMLRNEKINQVGSFVFTFLEQMPKNRRQELFLTDITDDVSLMNKFNTDFRRFSRAYESSFFMESMGMGAAAQLQSVFTPEGFLPRSMMVNLTVDVFGNNVNLLEMEGRSEGMERLVESLFGPGGYFGKNAKNKRSKNSKEERAIETIGYKYNAKKLFERDSVASIDMKVFGNSMMYKRFGMDEPNTVGVSFETMSLPEILNELAKQRDISFTKNIILFDTTFHVPTVAGMPLKLTLDGTASLDLKIKGKMDMKSLENIDVSGVFQPSGAIEISATMSVDANKKITSGLKVVATLHSSTMVDGMLKIQSGKMVKAQINVPRDNIELFDLQTRVFLVKNGEEQKPVMAYSNDINTHRKCVGSQILGMELCGELEVPSSRKGMPYFPLNGQTFFKTYLRKTDPALSRYDFDMSYNNQDDKTEFLVKFNTPGSSVDREVSALLQANYGDNDMTFNLLARSPNKKLTVTGKHNNNDAERRLNFAVAVDDMEKFSVEANMLLSGDGEGIRYSPSLIVRGSANNAQNLMTIRGNALMRDNEKYSADLSIEDLTTKPITFKGEVNLKNKNEILLGLSSSAVEVNMNCMINPRKNVYTIKGALDYKLMGKKSEKLEIQGKFRDQSANSLIKYSAHVSLSNSIFPQYSTDVQFETQMTDGHIENKLDLSVGDKKVVSPQKVTVSQILKYEGALSNNKVEANLRVIYPQQDIDFLIKGEHRNTETSVDDQMTIRLGPQYEYVMVSSGLLQDQTLRVNYKLDSTLGGPICNMELFFRKSEEKYITTLAYDHNGKSLVKADLTFSDKSDDRNMDYDLNADVVYGRNRKMMAGAKVTSTEGRHFVAKINANMGKGNYGITTQYTFTTSLNHRVSALVETPGKSYSAEIVTEGSSEQFNVNGEVLVGRKMTGLLKVTNTKDHKTCTLNLMFDADRDTDNSIRMESEYKRNDNKHQGNFNVVYMGKRVSGSFDGNAEGSLSKRVKGNMNAELNYAEGSRIKVEFSGHLNRKNAGINAQGDLKLQTPVQGMEEMSLNIQHVQTGNEMKNDINAEYTRGKKISLVTELKVSTDPNNEFLDIVTRLATPFRRYEYVSGKVLLKRNPSDSSFTIMGRRGGKVLELSAAHSKTPMSLTLNVTTPYVSLSQGSFFLAVEPTNEGRFKSQAEVMYNNRNQYTMGVDANTEYREKQRICSMEITATTTERDYERMRTKINYNHGKRGLSVDCLATLNNEKMTLGFTGNNGNSRSGKQLDGRLYYTTTSNYYGNGDINAKYVSDASKMATTVNGKILKDISFDSEMNYNSGDAIEIGANFNSKNMIGRAYSVITNLKLEQNRLTINGNINKDDSVNRMDFVALNSVARNQRNAHARMNMVAPDFGMRDVRFTIEHQQQGNVITTLMSGSYERSEIKASHELNFNDFSNFNSKLSVNTPARNYRSISVVIDQSLNRGTLVHSTEVTNSGRKVAAIQCEYRNRRSSRSNSVTEAKFNLVTPFETLSSLTVDGNMDMDTNAFFYQPKLSVTFNRGGRFDFEANANNVNNIPSVMAKLTSTIRGIEDMAFSGKYDFNNNEKVIESAFKFATEKEISGRVSYAKDKNVYTTRASLTTPFRTLRSAQYQGALSLRRNNKEADIKINYDNKEIALNGKYSATSFSLSYSTPYYGYENALLTGSYSGNASKLDCELRCEYSPNNKIVITLAHDMTDRLNSRLTINTPFRGYRSMIVQAQTETVGPLKSASFMAQLESSKPLRLTASTDQSDPLNFKLGLESPFKNAELISLDGSLRKVRGGSHQFSTNLQYAPDASKRITMNGELSLGNEKKIILNLDTPFRPCKNVELTVTYNDKLRATLQYDNPSKRMDLTISFEMVPSGYEGNFDLRTPFDDMERISVMARYSLDNVVENNGVIELYLPFRDVRYFKGEGVLKMSPENYNFELKTKTPSESSKTMSVSGSFKNSAAEKSFQIKAENFASNPIEMSGSIAGPDNNGLSQAFLNVNLGRRDEHSIRASLKNPQNGELGSTLQMRSRLLENNELNAKMNLNFADKRRYTFDASLDDRVTANRIYGSLRSNKQGFDYELKLNIPRISRDEMAAQITYTNSRKIVNGKLSVKVNDELHALEFNFDGSDNSQTTVNVEARCRLLPSGLVRLEGNMVQPKENSVDLTGKLISGETHTVTAKYNYNQRPYITLDGSLNIESPLLQTRAVSLSGNLVADKHRRFESSLLLEGLSNGQARLTINFKREEGRSLDGLINLNLPAGPVRMFRADMKANTDGTPQNSEFSLDVETSLQNVRHMSLSCKSKTSITAFDVSLNTKLPINGYESVSLLTTVHKNLEMTKIQPRITLTLPADKYVLFGNYENTDKLMASLGYEMRSRRGEVGVEVTSDIVKLTVQTPIRGHKNYVISADFKNEKNKKITVNFEDARSRRSTFQGTMRFQHLNSFLVETSLRTPYANFRDLSLHMRQQNRRGNMLTSFSFNSDGKAVASLTSEHETNSKGCVGKLEIVTPWESIQSMKSTHAFSEEKITTTSEWNGDKVIDLEANFENREKSFVLTLPLMMYTLKGSCKTGSTFEIYLQSVAPRRTMTFNTSLQNNNRLFQHSAEINFDEKENTIFSYDFRTATRNEGGNEMIVRVKMPVRSVELRAEQASTANGDVVTFNVLLDAARSPNKNYKFIIEHSETSGYNTLGRKIQCTFSNPQIRKEMTARAEYNINAKEFLVRAELEYSRDQQKNIVLEIRAQDQSQNKRECNYNLAILARNPAARVDLNIQGDLTNNKEEMGAGLRMTFMGHNGRERISELRGKIQKLEQKLEMMTRLNEDRLELIGRLFNRDREFTVEFDTKVNSEPATRGNLRVSRHHRNMDLSLTSGEETMNVKATMPEDFLHVELAHSTPRTTRVSDALFHLSLSKDRVLESRLNYRPDLMNDIQERANSAYNNGYYRTARYVEDSMRGASQEIEYASSRMRQIADREVNPLTSNLQSEMNEINNDFQRMINNGKHMYRRNEFYMQDIHEASNELLAAVSEMGSIMMNSIGNSLAATGRFIAEGCSYVARGLNCAMNRMLAHLECVQMKAMKMIDDVQEYLDEKYNELFYHFVMFSMDMGDAIDDALIYYGEKLGAMMEPIMNKMRPIFDKIGQMITSSVESICGENQCQSLMNMMSIDALVGYYRDTVRTIYEIVYVSAEYVREHETLNNMNEMVSKSLDNVRQTAYNLGIDTLAINIFEEIYAKTTKILFATLKRTLQDFTDLKSSVHLTMEPENGRVELKMRLPAISSGLVSLNGIDQIDFSQLTALKEALFDPNSFSDFYYGYKKYLDPDFYLPPFEGKAIIAGNQHYVTFDNFHFDYAGECSYLLAKDFVDGNFTVYVNYVQDDRLRAVRKSIVTIVDGVKMEIGSDYKVTKNDVKVELPQELTPEGHTKVIMDEGTILIKDEKRGFEVRCNLEHDICTVKLHGFYFAKTGGLLGNFNNEPALDQMTPENKLTENVEEFASSYQLGESSCRTANVAKQSRNEPEATEECEKLFKSNNSPMRACFKLVSPTPYMNMCVNDLSNVRRSNERQKKTCTAIAAYLDKCRDEGVELRMPKHCIRCERHDNQEMEGGEMIKITTPTTKSSDVVFLVEQVQCNKNTAQILNRMAIALEDRLQREGFNKIRFSVVGFGGKGIHNEPHIVTIDGKAFGNAKSLTTTLENLPLRDDDFSYNVFDALRFAARLPFMAGASKTFVLAKCSSCKAEEMKGDYSEMLRTMLDGDITLHGLFDLELPKSNKLKKVIGFDRENAYTSKDTQGDKDLRSALKVPKDLCVPLSIEINGSIFIPKRMLMKRGEEKKNIDNFVNRIMKTLQPPECQLCECLTTSYGIGKSVCQRCVSPVVASMSMDDFYTEDATFITPVAYKKPTAKSLSPRNRKQIKRN